MAKISHSFILLLMKIVQIIYAVAFVVRASAVLPLQMACYTSAFHDFVKTVVIID